MSAREEQLKQLLEAQEVEIQVLRNAMNRAIGNLSCYKGLQQTAVTMAIENLEKGLKVKSQ
jgi:hypothetical protein